MNAMNATVSMTTTAWINRRNTNASMRWHHRRRRSPRNPVKPGRAVLGSQRHVTIPSLGAAAGVVSVGHQRDADQRARRLAEAALKVGEQIATIAAPPAQVGIAILQHDL